MSRRSHLRGQMNVPPPATRSMEDILVKALIAAALAVGIAGPGQAGERLKLPLFDASLVLPDEWTSDVPERRPIPAKTEERDFQVQVTATCRSIACKASLDVCTVKTYDDIMPLYDIVAGFTYGCCAGPARPTSTGSTRRAS